MSFPDYYEILGELLWSTHGSTLLSNLPFPTDFALSLRHFKPYRLADHGYDVLKGIIRLRSDKRGPGREHEEGCRS